LERDAEIDRVVSAGVVLVPEDLSAYQTNGRGNKVAVFPQLFEGFVPRLRQIQLHSLDQLIEVIDGNIKLPGNRIELVEEGIRRFSREGASEFQTPFPEQNEFALLVRPLINDVVGVSAECVHGMDRLALLLRQK